MVPLSPTRPRRWLALLVVMSAVACGRSADRADPPTTAVTTAPPTTAGTALLTTTAPTTVPATTSPPTTAPPTTVSAGPAQVVSRGDANRRTVALTFDAGADAGHTAQILDVLDRSAVKSTFGIAGRWAEEYPDLVRRIAAAGHLVMNHSYEHRSFTGVSARPGLLSAAERVADVERADNAIRALTGQSTLPWFRSPYGDYDASLQAVLGSLGYRYNVLWTVDSLGWQGLSAGSITTRCLERAVPGAILLFHVGSTSQDAAALPDIITGLRSAGYGFGTVADVIGG